MKLDLNADWVCRSLGLRICDVKALGATNNVINRIRMALREARSKRSEVSRMLECIARSSTHAYASVDVSHSNCHGLEYASLHQ